MESGGLADQAGLPHDSYSTAGFDKRIARCYYSGIRYTFCCILMQNRLAAAFYVRRIPICGSAGKIRQKVTLERKEGI